MLWVHCVVTAGLLLTASAEKKVNLEDIERDNLKSEGGGIQKSYQVKPETDAEDYRAGQTARGFGEYNRQYHVDSYMQANQPSYEYQQDADYPEQDSKEYYLTPEVNVGNRYQSIQQKVATEQSNGHKNTVYIPMSQLLAYYAYLSGQGSPNKHLTSPGQQGRQISIPLYTAEPYSAPVYMSKLHYKPQPQPQPQFITYASQYPSHTQAVLGKNGQSKLYSHGPQQQFQELEYPSDIKSDQYYRYVTPEQLQYLVATKSIYQEAPEYQPEGLMPPQSPAQNFKSSYQSTSESNRLHLQNYMSHSSSQPKSLLDSYVPSHIIAAQDAERYRERPIKLESGFLPSKINFIHSYKKRKTQ